MSDRCLALAAGGTGGHLFPAQALAEEMKRRGWRILLVTDDRGARYADSFPADERADVSAGTPSIGGPVAKMLAATSLVGGFFSALGVLKRNHVAAAVGFGGYPSLPTMMAARMSGVPYGVHEQNAVLGRANRAVAGGAAFVACAFPRLDKLPAGASARLHVVGNPIRDAVAEFTGAPYAPPAKGPIELLVFGGSQGARILADSVPGAVAGLAPALRERIAVTHQARPEDVERVKAAYQAAGVSAEIAPFFTDLARRIAAAHLVVARAGASTVTELAAIGRPSILVPLAIAMDDHQTANAGVLAGDDAAVVVNEANATPGRMAREIAALLTAPDHLAQMAARARGLAPDRAAARLADLVEAAASRRPISKAA